MNDRFSADNLPTKAGFGPHRSPWPIDLAHMRPFPIGGAEVRPASREIVRGDQSKLLEPLVMQVLVALASAKGEILSRDDLIAACWGGRAVTDDAVNRVVSRLRTLGRSFGSFKIETITKVGYRLVDGEPITGNQPASKHRRQILMVGGAFAGLGALGLAGWRMLDRPEIMSPQAEILIQKGMAALQYNDALETQEPGATMQAIALLSDATRVAPDSATAWGALALAYAVRRRNADLPERPGFDARCRAAARRALALDSIEARAIGALLMLRPVYRNWLAAERANRQAVAMNSGLPILLFIMSDMLGSVGRWREALQFSKRHDRRRFLIPGADRKLLVDLWAAGDLTGADNALDVAVRQWPQHAQVWRTRLAYLMYTGRPREVLNILRDETTRPLEIKDAYVDAIRTTAEALAGQRAAADAVSHDLAYLKANPSSALHVAQACVALGDTDAAFNVLQGYYFAEGLWSFVTPTGGDQDRITNPLFHPVMEKAWKVPQFGRLLARTGLEAYWRQSGTRPDFRRA